MDKQTLAEHWAIKGDKLSTGTTPRMNLKCVVLRERCPNQKATKVGLHRYNILEKTKPQGQKIDHWLPGDGDGKRG